MTTQKFAKWIVYALTLQACMSFASTPVAHSRPNIVFILADDHRYDAMGFLGKYPWLQTPNMDRIAKEGALFENAFVTISVCAPSRASFLTGLYPHKHGVSSNMDQRECNWDKTPSFGQYLHQAGYRTGYIGKWHMYHNNTPRPGWDFWATFSGQGRYKNNDIVVNGKPVFEKDYITDVLTRYAVDFLETDDGRPFLLYLSHKAVHAPFTPAERHENMYQNERLPETPNRNYEMKGKPEWQKKHSPGQAVFLNEHLIKSQGIKLKGPAGDGTQKRFIKYVKALKAVDESIGTVLDTLEKTGKLDNTLVIYAGDNGFLFGEHRRGDKRLAYEESIRIPFLMRWPEKIPAGRIVKKDVLNIDLAPTLLDIAGCSATKTPMDGVSLRPLFKNDDVPWRTGFLYTYFRDFQPVIPTLVGYRTDEFIVVHSLFREGDLQEFYNLKKDPYQIQNLYYNPEYKMLRDQMIAKMEQEKTRLNYRADVPDPNPERFGNPKQGVVFDFFQTNEGKRHGNMFTEESHVAFPVNPNANFADPLFRISLTLNAESDGIVTSQGNGVMGLVTAVYDGRFRCILFRGNKQHPPGAKYILESKSPILNQNCEISVEYDDNLKIARLIVDKKLQAEAHIANSYGRDLGGKGTVTVGHVNSGFSGELKKIGLTNKSFTGKLHKCKMVRTTSSRP